MKKTVILLSALLSSLVFFSASLFAQEQEDIISLFKGSEIIFADEIGFETHYYLSGPSAHKAIDGKMRRQFCSVPEGISSYEVVKNYEKAILAKEGTIIYFSRNANRYNNKETGERVRFMQHHFTHGRVGHNHYEHMQLPNYAKDYVVGKVSTASNDIFISVAAVAIDGPITYYELVTVVAEPMDMDNVTLNVLNDGIAASGRVAIYDIYFDIGKHEVKSESTNALTIIANYLKENPDKTFLIVGHTDNTGDFKANVTLSNDRANAVIEKLVSEHGITQTQLIPYGVGSASPQISNTTDEGKARNRRVELVEL
ncbi:MAG: OmpA family protein [Bacteroidales bacterium]|jgi:outer membrane protein OmpA-like peptidoglycan-associated protein|nr:OmpA family protein [Bacteroidales bacterium]